jgi:hypothetical protein
LARRHWSGKACGRAAAELDAHGQWKIYKKRQSRKIDALYAAIIASSRAAGTGSSVYEERGALVL